MALHSDAIDRHPAVLEALHQPEHRRPPRRIDRIVLGQAIIVNHQLCFGVELSGSLEGSGDIFIAIGLLKAVAAQIAIAAFSVDHLIDDDPFADLTAIAGQEGREMPFDSHPVAGLGHFPARPVRGHLFPDEGMAADLLPGGSRIRDDGVVIAMIRLAADPFDRAPLTMKFGNEQLAVAPYACLQRSARDELCGLDRGAEKAAVRGRKCRAAHRPGRLRGPSHRLSEWAGRQSGEQVAARQVHGFAHSPVR